MPISKNILSDERHVMAKYRNREQRDSKRFITAHQKREALKSQNLSRRRSALPECGGDLG